MKEAVLVFGGKKAKGTGFREREVERPAVHDHFAKGEARLPGKADGNHASKPAAAPAASKGKH